jgi:hypothetical protein
MAMRDQQPVLWIGLVEFKPLNRESYGHAGAFTNIVTWAKNQDGFRQKVEVIAATIDMYVFAVEWAEPLADRTARMTMTEEIDEMVLRAESNPNAIVWGTFYTYPFDVG